MSGSTTSLTISRQFFEPGTEYKLEVLGGNQTISASSFARHGTSGQGSPRTRSPARGPNGSLTAGHTFGPAGVPQIGVTARLLGRYFGGSMVALNVMS